MKKQFDLQYYKKHPSVKIVTRNRLPVRILCTDRKDLIYPIVALIDDNGSEVNVSYTIDGYMYSNKEHWGDIFFDFPDHRKKKVPLTHKDLLERVKAGKTMWMHSTLKEVNGCDIVRFVIDFDHLKVYYALVNEIENYSYYDLIDIEMHFADGDPCWKEVEE